MRAPKSSINLAKFSVLFLCILCFLSAEMASAQSQRWRKGIVKDEFIYKEAPFPSAHASTIAETPQGITAAWFGGTYERNPDVGIWLSRKRNGQWTEPEQVADGNQNGKEYPCWNPVLFQVPGGKTLLFYKVGPSPAQWWGMKMTSDDGGKTWSKPERLPDGILGPIKNKPVLLDNGNLISGSSTEDNGWQVHLEISPDSGKTWKKVGPINGTDNFNVIQPTILNHGNGKLQILCRSKSRAIVQAWSDDYGETWSAMEKSSLPNNNSGIDAVTLNGGRFLLVYNHVLPPKGQSKGARTPLNVSVSKDGKNWSAALILEDSHISQYSYPAVIQTRDGLVHIVYTWRRKRIKHVVVDPSKLELTPISNGKWPK